MEKAYIVCDGGYSSSTKVMDYQSFQMPEKKRLFYKKFLGGTNNIAEFLAIVDSLRYAKENGLDLKVYSDSITGACWVRNKKINTTMKFLSGELMGAILQAQGWLRDNPDHNQVCKWPTHQLGENPADFSRK